MGALLPSAACVLVLLTAAAVHAQDLPPALADRFSQGVADLKAGRLDAAERAFRDILRDGGARAFVHHNLGIVLRERGRHTDAVAEFRAAMKLDPSFGPARLLGGTSLLALGRAREARSELEQAVRLMPEQTVAHLQLAEACQRLDDRACVADAYRRVAELAPDDPEHAYQLGSAYLELAKWAYERISTSDPSTPGLHLALARIHFDQGRLEDAAREIANELARVPSSQDALALKSRMEGSRREPLSPAAGEIDVITSPVPVSAVRRADIDAAIGARDWDRAERLLAEEIERQPRSRELLALIARVFFLDGKPLNTAVALKKAEALAPLDRDLRFLLVLSYVRLGRLDWARPELEQLVQSHPTIAEYRYWIGRLDYDAGKYADAVSRFKEALARDPGFMRAHDNLGLSYEALDRVDEAIGHYKEALRLNREAEAKSPWPPTNLGILLRQRGNLDEAASLFREALSYGPNFAKAHYELGVLFDQQERTDDALTELARASSIDPTYPEPHYVRARIYRRQGKAALADESLAEFLRVRAMREQTPK